MTAPTQPSIPALDAEGRVAADVPCARCGYNVRTLSAAGVCPECAHPVAWSLRGSGLHYASPVWLRRINGGVLVLLCALGAVLVGVAGWIGATMYVGLADAQSGSPAVREYSVVGAVIFFGWCALWLAVGMVGLLLLTAREPLARECRADSLARRFTRVCLATAVILAALAALLLMLARALSGLSFPPFRVLSAGAWCAAVLVALVVPFTILYYLARLMQRAARPALTLFARIVAWCLLGFVVLMVVAWVAMIAQAAAMGPASTSSATFTPGFYVTMLASGLGFCGSVVAGVALFVLLILVRQTLTRVTREAEQNERVANDAVQSALPGA